MIKTGESAIKYSHREIEYDLCIESRDSNKSIDNIGQYISIRRWILIPVHHAHHQLHIINTI